MSFERLFERLGQLGLGHSSTDEEFLAGSVGEGDGFPAVLSGDCDVDFDQTFGIADGADDAGDDRADVVAEHEAVEDRAQVVEDTVLDFEFAFACAETERRHLETFPPRLRLGLNDSEAAT